MATLDDSISSFSGQSWSQWAEQNDKYISKETKSEHNLQTDESKGDSMKLRKEDMGLYGLCPARDEFYLVVCECCGQVIKPQALKKHLFQRHGVRSKSSSSESGGPSSSHSSSLKEKTSQSSTPSTSHSSKGHSHSSSNAHKPSKRPSSPPPQSHCKDKPSPVSKSKRTPMVKVQRIESTPIKKNISSLAAPVSTSTLSSSSSFARPNPAEPPDKEKKPREKEKVEPPPLKTPKKDPDAMPPTTTAVTCMSSTFPVTTTNSIFSVPKVTTMTTRPNILSISTVSSAASHTTPTKEPAPKVTTTKTIVTAIPVTTVSKNTQPSPQTPTSTTTAASVTPAKTSSSSSSSATSISSTSSSKKSGKERKNVLCRDREYDADKHCGVWVADDNRQCTRSLTCKTHALSLRRAVEGRIKPFDDLLKEHREAKEALLKAKAEANGTPLPTPSSKSKSSKSSAPSTPVTVAPSPFKCPTTESIVTTPTLLSPPPVKSPAAAAAVVTQPKEKLCLNSSFTRQSSLPLFPKAEPVILPETTNYLSSDGEEDDEDKDKTDYTFINHHPRPAAVNSFGGWRNGGGCYMFNRKEDLYRAAFFAAVERHLHPPPHKKLCVESNLPKGSTIMTNAKDPYEFSIENASTSMRRSMASRLAMKSPTKPKVTLGNSPPCGSSKTVSDITSPTSILSAANVLDFSDSLLSPTNSVTSVPTAKRKRSGSSPIRSSGALNNGNGAPTIIGSSNLGTVTCSSPIAITIPASLSFNLSSSTLSNINATLAANKAGAQTLRGAKNPVTAKDLNRISSSDAGGHMNGQLVSISAPNLADMTHIQLNSLSEQCAKAKSNRNTTTNKATYPTKSSASQSSVAKAQFSKAQSNILRGHKMMPILSRKGSSSSSSAVSGSSLTFPLLSSMKPGGLLQLDTHLSNSLTGSAAVTLTTTSSSGSSGSLSSTQPSPVQLSSPILLSGASSPTSPVPNGLLSPTNPMGKYGGNLNHMQGGDGATNINLALTEQFLQHAPTVPFSLTAKSDSGLSRGLSSSSARTGGPTQVTLSAAAATAQQLAAAALNLTTQPGCILTTNSSTMPQIYATHVLAKSSPNAQLASLQLQAKPGLKGITATAGKVPLQPLSLTIVAPGTGVQTSQHQQAHMVLHTADEPQSHTAASNIPS